MKCPDCSTLLTQIDYRFTNKDLITKITYCPNCNGFWLDSITVNNLQTSDVERIQRIIENNHPKVIPGSHLCPQCEVLLKPLRQESIPLNVKVSSCPQCQFKWFGKGQLLQFKKAQETKVNYYKQWQIPLKSIFAILLPVLVIVSIVSFVNNQHRVIKQPQIYIQEQTSLKISTPQVDANTFKEVKVKFSTSMPAKTQLFYTVDKASGETIVINDTEKLNHEAKIRNLRPNQQYWFILSAEANGQTIHTDYYSFTTPDD